MKYGIVLVLLLCQISTAGIQRIFFFYHKVSYKDGWGRTRHKQFIINQFDEEASHKWLGHGFLTSTPNHGAAVYLSDGTIFLNFITSVDDVRSIYVNPSKLAYGSASLLSRWNPTQPNMSELKNIVTCPDKSVFLQATDGWKLVAGLWNPSIQLDSWKGITGPENLVGIAAACNKSDGRLYSLSIDGELSLWDNGLNLISKRLLAENTSRHFLSLKSDGVTSPSGEFTMWAQTVEMTGGKKKFGLEKIDVSSTGEILSQNYRLYMPADAATDKKNGALQVWDDFIPFYTGADNVRILALSKNRIHVFSDQGVWLDSPWGNVPPTQAGAFDNWRIAGAFYQARTIVTDNNRLLWPRRQEFYVADNPAAGGGHGIHRFQYTPDGFDDYVRLEVQTKNTASVGEKISRINIRLKNLSETRQVVHPKARIWLSREELYPDEIVCDKYYIQQEGASCSVGCSDKNPNLCWADIDLGPDFSLDQAAETGENDILVGLHGKNWNSWDIDNDASLKRVGPVWGVNDDITIYDQQVTNGPWVRIWGNEPTITSVPMPVGWLPGNPAVDQTLSFVKSFDNIVAWNAVSDFTPQLVTVEKQEGLASLKVAGGRWCSFESIPFSVETGFSNISFWVFCPQEIPNPWWLGQIQVSFSAHSVGLYNQWVGQSDIKMDNYGNWKRVELSVPSWIREKMLGGASDAVIRINVNTAQGTNDILFDNLELQ